MLLEWRIYENLKIQELLKIFNEDRIEQIVNKCGTEKW
jgi:hypothetical protein